MPSRAWAQGEGTMFLILAVDTYVLPRCNGFGRREHYDKHLKVLQPRELFLHGATGKCIMRLHDILLKFCSSEVYLWVRSRCVASAFGLRAAGIDTPLEAMNDLTCTETSEQGMYVLQITFNPSLQIPTYVLTWIARLMLSQIARHGCV